MRETPIASRHLHVPLQSGDDDVLRAMGRRYTIGQYRAQARAARGLQSHDRRDRRLSDRGRARVREHDDGGGGDRDHEGARLPVLAAARHADGRRRSRAPAVKKERSARLRAASDTACRARWSSRVGSEDVVLVDRPGLGYADDYTPWLVDAPVG